jgi:hypothetical protein
LPRKAGTNGKRGQPGRREWSKKIVHNHSNRSKSLFLRRNQGVPSVDHSRRERSFRPRGDGCSGVIVGLHPTHNPNRNRPFERGAAERGEKTIMIMIMSKIMINGNDCARGGGSGIVSHQLSMGQGRDILGRRRSPGAAGGWGAGPRGINAKCGIEKTGHFGTRTSRDTWRRGAEGTPGVILLLIFILLLLIFLLLLFILLLLLRANSGAGLR